MNGFIKIYRSFLEWEWWDDINTFRLFMTCLLLANWKDKKWHGKVIPRGSFWTSLPSLSKKSGLTLQQTRTALAKLKSTGELTDRATGEGRLITVENYDFYQAVDYLPTDKSTDDLTDNQQTSNRRPNRRATSTEEREEYKKEKKGKKSAPSVSDYIQELMEELDNE